MNDKRKFPRHACKIKSKFDYYEGNPDEIDINIQIPEKHKGTVIDISRNGAFIVSNCRVAVGMPIVVHFKFLKEKVNLQGHIVRTGLLENNPSEVARKFAIFSSTGDSYIAVEFNEILDDFSANDL